MSAPPLRRNIADRGAAATADIAAIGHDGGPGWRRRHHCSGGDRGTVSPRWPRPYRRWRIYAGGLSAMVAIGGGAAP